MKLAKLTVHAGWHERLWCPVETELALDPVVVAVKNLTLWDTTDGLRMPVQAWHKKNGKVGLIWMIPALAPQENRSYELHHEDDVPITKGVHLEMPNGSKETDKANKLNVYVGGQYFTTYNYGNDVVRPYLYPVLAAPGVGITRNWPMVEGVSDETNDHPHHKGIYTAQGEVNGVDNWSEGRSHGWQIHRAFIKRYEGPVSGGFTQALDWTDAKRNTVMTETRRMTFYLSPRHARLFDYEVTLHASEGKVTLGDTKEAGLLSVRVASSMDAERETGGRIENGYGGLQEAETWGKRAPWCDYAGPIGSDGRRSCYGTPLWYGIGLMDHIDNPRHPTYWHVRNYGLMAANCFGLHHFAADPNRRWDLVIPAGASLTWRYRVLIHHGDAQAAQAAIHYHNFVHAPTVEKDISASE